MTTTVEQVVPISIMGRTYSIKCPKEKTEQLQEAAHYLDLQMRKVQASSHSNHTESLAIVAALNITQELIGFYTQKTEDVDMTGQIKSLQSRISECLNVKDEALV